MSCGGQVSFTASVMKSLEVLEISCSVAKAKQYIWNLIKFLEHAGCACWDTECCMGAGVNQQGCQVLCQHPNS